MWEARYIHISWLEQAKRAVFYLCLPRPHGRYNADSDNQIVQSFAGAITNSYFSASRPTSTDRYISVAQATASSNFRSSTENSKLIPTLNHRSIRISRLFHYLGERQGRRDCLATRKRSRVGELYDASNLSKELYNRNQVASARLSWIVCRFFVPIVANGKLYAGTRDSLVVYGLLPQAKTSAPTANLVHATRAVLQ